jgi:hypothetical protein
MGKPGSAAVASSIFIESLTCYRGWVGSVFYIPPRGFIPAIWSFEVIRHPDWLSASLRADKLGKSFSSVELQMPSGDIVTLYEAQIGAFGAAVWRDPKHHQPSGPLEMVTYNCAELDVDSSGVLPGYDWWQLNA